MLKVIDEFLIIPEVDLTGPKFEFVFVLMMWRLSANADMLMSLPVGVCEGTL